MNNADNLTKLAPPTSAFNWADFLAYCRQPSNFKVLRPFQKQRCARRRVPACPPCCCRAC
jgi:hypothetical protein